MFLSHTSVTLCVYIYVQSMKYIKLRAYKTGGVNITGFEIFRQTDALMRSYFSDPSSQNNVSKYTPENIFLRL